MGGLKDWYDRTGPAQRKSKDWKKMARADFKMSTDPLGLIWKNEKFYDRDTGEMIDKKAIKAMKKRKQARTGMACGGKTKMSSGGAIKSRQKGPYKPKKMASGGKVTCRGMGCATRGGGYNKDG